MDGKYAASILMHMKYEQTHMKYDRDVTTDFFVFLDRILSRPPTRQISVVFDFDGCKTEYEKFSKLVYILKYCYVFLFGTKDGHTVDYRDICPSVIDWQDSYAFRTVADYFHSFGYTIYCNVKKRANYEKPGGVIIRPKAYSSMNMYYHHIYKVTNKTQSFWFEIVPIEI